MKRYGIVAIAAALLLAAGCSSKPGAESQLIEHHHDESTGPATTETDPPAENVQEDTAVTEPSEDAGADKGTDKTTDKAADPAVEPAGEDKPAVEPKEEVKKETKKLTKTEKKVQEAVKKNEEISKAVTDSIMDKSQAQSAAKSEQAKQLKQAIEKIRAQVKDLKQHADSNDSALMKDTAALITESWTAMKADVKSSAPSMVDFLDEKITTLNTLKDADPIDQEAVLQVDYELYQSLRQLADKLGVS